MRNARLNFREQEPTHIMENIIYNELISRGFNVDVGIVETSERNSKTDCVRKQLEVDFICNLESKRYYVQSCYQMSDPEKLFQEERPYTKIVDSFKKVIVVRDDIKPYLTDLGTLSIGLKDFLLNKNSLDI